MIGIISNIVAYMPVIILIQLYKRTSSHVVKTTRLENALDNMLASNKSKKSKINSNIKKSFTFPWWFKIFLYLISFGVMAASISLVTFKGIDMGDENVQNWLVSLIISTLFGMFITLPIQVRKKCDVKEGDFKNINLN